jgi:hypothetical protein
MSRHDAAYAFFEACDAGEGWPSCRDFRNQSAALSWKADILAGDAKALRAPGCA